MASPLASLFSTIESAKRVLADRLSNPVADVQRTLSRAKEDATAFDAKVQGGGSQATEAMLNAALNFMGGGGLGGMIVPAKVMNYGNARAAEKLISGGNTTGAWRSHGVYKDAVDQQLKAVLSDAGAKFKPDTVTGDLLSYQSPTQAGPHAIFRLPWRTTPLADILDHPELQKALPDIYNTVKVSPGTGVGGGAYSAKDNTIWIDAGTSPKDMLSTLLHEIQHAVQSNYGFATGGNSGQFIGNAGAVAANEKALRELAKTGQDLGTGGIRSLIRDLEKAQNAPGKEAFNRYLQIPGEVEARTVQKMFESDNYKVNPQSLQLKEFRKLGPAQPQRWAEDTPEYKALTAALGELGLVKP